MSKRAFRLALVTVVAVVLLLGVVGLLGARAVMSYADRRHAGKGQGVQVEIGKGMALPSVARALADAHVIDRPTWFRVYVLWNGKSDRLRAGKYTLRDDMTPREVLATLVKGVEDVQVDVTIPEGKNLREVFALVAEAGVADAAELEKLARDPAFLKEHGITGETVEGYLFPDKYRFKAPTPAAAVLERMIDQHRKVYAEEAEKHAKHLAKIKKDLGWSDREIVTMASIVERETGQPEERPRVASVFYNRLVRDEFKSKRLETDPTIRYGCTIPAQKSEACKAWDPAGRLHRAQLDDEANPYNTYQHPGLPPGPISNPGRASLAAAMDPERTDFFFFVAKDEKSHVFARTVEEHQRNVNTYQR